MDKFNSDISKITREGNELVTQHYSDITPLHESGNGAFCLFRASRFGKRLVLKALKPQFRGDPFYEAILQKEFMIGDSLSHRSIISTIDYTNLPETGNCIVLEYINGVTLRQYLIDNNPLPNNEAKRIITSICEAAGYLHSHKIVHRDLKPENIMVERQTDAVKIIDLGCADATDYNVIKGPAGTRHYAAPEQLTPGNEIDARTDIFAIGKIMLDIIDATEPPLKRLSHIALRCSAADLADRYSSTYEIISAVNKKRIASMWVYIATAIALLVGGMAYWLTSRHELRLYPPLIALAPDSSAADSKIDTILPKQSHASVDTIMSKSEMPTAIPTGKVASSIVAPQPQSTNTEQSSTNNVQLKTPTHDEVATTQTSSQLNDYIRREKADSIFMYHAAYIKENAEWKFSGVYNDLLILQRRKDVKSLQLTIDDVFMGKQKEKISENIYMVSSKYTEDVKAELMQYVSSYDAEVYIMRLEQIFNSAHTRFRNSAIYKNVYQPHEDDDFF